MNRLTRRELVAYVLDQRRKAIAWHDEHGRGRRPQDVERDIFGLMSYDKGSIDAYSDVLDRLGVPRD